VCVFFGERGNISNRCDGENLISLHPYAYPHPYPISHIIVENNTIRYDTTRIPILVYNCNFSLILGLGVQRTGREREREGKGNGKEERQICYTISP